MYIRCLDPKNKNDMDILNIVLQGDCLKGSREFDDLPLASLFSNECGFIENFNREAKRGVSRRR